MFRQLIDDTAVDLVIVFGIGRDGSRSRQSGGSGKCRRRARRDPLETRHLHIASEAAVKGEVAPRLIYQVDRRIDLIVVGEAAQAIPAHTKVGAQFLRQLPGVLQIDSRQQIDLVGIVDHADRQERRTDLVAGRVDVEHQ